MMAILLLTIGAVCLSLVVGAILAGIPLLLQLRRLLQDDARRDGDLWASFEGGDA